MEQKCFSLFNVSRWADVLSLPTCCGVVPLLYQGDFTTDIVDATLQQLAVTGSIAGLGFDKPEGVVVFHAASHSLFKVLLENDSQPKGNT